MAASKKRGKEHGNGHLVMDTPPIVSPQEWAAAREKLLVKEKAVMRARDALAAERRRMPWQAVRKKYEFDGPKGKIALLDLFEDRRQLIIYRAFFEPGYSAGPSTPVAAAPWGPTRSAISPTSTPATPRSRTSRAHRKRTSSN
jgi:predicted dithiol-disulfide oxidoreductase (DUF899 family)